MLAVVVFAFGSIAAAPLPQAGDADRYRAQARRAQARLDVLTREARRLAATEKTLLADLRALELERERCAIEVERVEAELSAVTADQERAATEAQQIEAVLDTERPIVAARLARLYMMGTRSVPRWWAGVAGVRDAGRAWRMLSGLASIDRRRLAAYDANLARLSAARAALAERAREIEGLRVEAEAARRSADAAAARQAARARAVAERRDLAEQMAAELAQASERLQAAVAGLATGASATPDVLPLRAFRGGLDWPLAGQLAARFGRQRESRFGTMTVRNGVDIASTDGTEVRAVHEGRVAFADVFTGFGRLVIVDHGGGAYSLYGNLRDVGVTRGASVDAGSPLGTVGRSPTGQTVLYFELRIDGRPVDPLEWLKPWTEARTGPTQ